jgi:hyperosmotically inducible periplasmic protein
VPIRVQLFESDLKNIHKFQKAVNMKKQLLLLSSLTILLVACERREIPRPPQEVVSENVNDTNTDVDNTGRNGRDRRMDTITPVDQSESKPDLKITQLIRKTIIENHTLSTNAHNIKIITNNGVVTLRGVVNSEREREIILRIVSGVEGISRVNNLLEVKQINK